MRFLLLCFVTIVVSAKQFPTRFPPHPEAIRKYGCTMALIQDDARNRWWHTHVWAEYVDDQFDWIRLQSIRSAADSGAENHAYKDCKAWKQELLKRITKKADRKF
jgi:hypothetical protein